MRLAVLVLLSTIWSATSLAGTISVQGSKASGPAIVRVSGGRLTVGDGFRFYMATAPFRDVVVVLDSPGGMTAEGMNIAETVRARGFSTMVRPGETCASVCALIWLAGRQRYLAEGARIGFHSAEIVPGGRVSHYVNAIYGTFLSGLGYGPEVAKFSTSATPQSIVWLSKKKAVELNIQINLPALSTLAAAKSESRANGWLSTDGPISSNKVSFGRNLLRWNGDAKITLLKVHRLSSPSTIGAKIDLRAPPSVCGECQQ